MRTKLLLACAFSVIAGIVLADKQVSAIVEWKEVWREEFRGDRLDETNWSYISHAQAVPQPYTDDYKKLSWSAHITEDPIVHEFTGETLQLLGMKNPDRAEDARSYLCGGIMGDGRNKENESDNEKTDVSHVRILRDLLRRRGGD